MRAGSILTYPRQVLLRMPVTADSGRAGRGGNQFPGRVPGPRARLVRRRRDHHREDPERQRRLLAVTELGRRLRRTGHHPQADPPLPAPDQRQGRALPPHPRRRMGLRPPLRHRTPRRPWPLAPHLQPSPRTHRAERPPASQPRHQPLRTEHLGVDLGIPHSDAASRGRSGTPGAEDPTTPGRRCRRR